MGKEQGEVFEWRGQNLRTIPEIIDAGLALTTEEDREELRQKLRALGPHALSNVGYFAGYYNTETAQKILDVFKTSHPIFGTDWPKKPISPEEAFEIGKSYGEKMKESSRG